MNFNTKKLVYTAAIAAIYAALTLAIAPIAYGPMQFRLSEVMTLLALYNPQFAPGLILGCFLANLFSPFGAIDVIVGTLATAIAVLSMARMKNGFFASLMPTITNGLMIGAELWFLLGLPLLETIAYVALGEFIVVTVIGLPLYKVITSRFPAKSLAK